VGEDDPFCALKGEASSVKLTIYCENDALLLSCFPLINSLLLEVFGG